MESLIEKFLFISPILNGNGYGDGDGDGDGHGSGYGNGYGYGSGHGNGYGYGYGDGDGDGDGYGYGGGLKQFNNNKVYYIDHVPTLIYSIKNNIALGAIINSDLSLQNCYIVKNDSYFAHGKSIKEAFQSLQEKVFRNLSEEEILIEFKKVFPIFSEKYPALNLFTWHGILTGSCKLGRESFCKNNNINIESDNFTIYEFITLTKDNYNGKIIEKLLN